MGDNGGSTFQSSVDEDDTDLSSAAISLPLEDNNISDCNFCEQHIISHDTGVRVLCFTLDHRFSLKRNETPGVNFLVSKNCSDSFSGLQNVSVPGLNV